MVEPFKQTFFETQNLVPEQIYNADESGIFWRLLPEKTFVHKNEDQAPGRGFFFYCLNMFKSSRGRKELKL